MIGKTSSLSNSTINKNLPEEKRKNGKGKEQNERELSKENQKENQKENSKENGNSERQFADFNMEEVVEFLNSNEYYKSKDMTFSLSEDQGVKLVFVMNKKKEVIQRLPIPQAIGLFQLLKSKSKDTPLKGGILNINC